jgi:hypothetical protein
MVGVLGRWGDNSELRIVFDLLRAVLANADKVREGLTVLLGTHSYPAVLIFTAYSLGLTRAERWHALHTFLSAQLTRQHDDPQRIVETFFLWSWEGDRSDIWKKIEGLEKRRTPLSDHLLEVFTPWAKSFGGISPEFELLFERFEILASLAFLDSAEKAEIEAALANPAPGNYFHMPVGRSGWHDTLRNRLVKEIQTERMTKGLLDAGFARGSEEYLKLFLSNFGRIAARMRWW